MTQKHVIIILSVALAACLFVIFKLQQPGKEMSSKDFQPNFNDEVNDSVGRILINNYRKRWSLSEKNKIVLYDTSKIRAYLDVTFGYLTQRITKPDKCKWMLGFYCMRRPDDNGKNKLDFLVVPTMVDTTTKPYTVLDFYEHKDAYRATRPVTTTMMSPPCPTCTGYDAGQLWP